MEAELGGVDLEIGGRFPLEAVTIFSISRPLSLRNDLMASARRNPISEPNLINSVVEANPMISTLGSRPIERDIWKTSMTLLRRSSSLACSPSLRVAVSD